MHGRSIAAVAAALVVMHTVAPIVGADQTFHTQHIALTPVGSAPLRTGFVVDIHANGPEINSLERYVLNGAAPEATYQVQLLVYRNSICTGPQLGVVKTASLVTNGSGNAEGSWTFVPSDISPSLHGTTIGIVWEVLSGRQRVAYQTSCIAVAVD
jgi:hypothetical protein